MNAEIIAIGTEMLTTQRIDTNSLFLADLLQSRGVEVLQKTVIGDDLARLTQGISGALGRCEILILSGGLGPTEDDLTREAAARALGRELIYVEEIYRGIEERFARLGRKISIVNRRQAYLLDGAIKLDNPNGTAPGQWIDFNGRILMMLPGPPRELKPMFVDSCLPRLDARLPTQVIRTRQFRIAGMSESDLDHLIAPAYKPYTNPVTTILAAAGDLHVLLRARSAAADEAQALVDEVAAKIEALLGNRIYSTNGDPLEAVVGEKLASRSETLAVAESCTGGLLATRITDAPGSSRYFAGGFVTYAIGQKIAILGVDPALIERDTAVSEAVACAMADGARKRAGATYALAITGEAGPESATPGVDPGTVWIGLAGPRQVFANQYRFPGNRGLVRSFAAQAALNLLRHALA